MCVLNLKPKNVYHMSNFPRNVMTLSVIHRKTFKTAAYVRQSHDALNLTVECVRHALQHQRRQHRRHQHHQYTHKQIHIYTRARTHTHTRTLARTHSASDCDTHTHSICTHVRRHFVLLICTTHTNAHAHREIRCRSAGSHARKARKVWRYGGKRAYLCVSVCMCTMHAM